MKISFRNHECSYIIVLIIFGLIDYVTSNTLSFIDIGHPINILKITRFEDVLLILIVIGLVACILTYLFASQLVFFHTILVTAALSTLGLFLDICGLLLSLFNRIVDPRFLLMDAALMYVSTVLLFTIWYWILDYKHQQAQSSGEVVPPAIVFPLKEREISGYENWKPGFIDYLFLSFHTSSTVGPTDTLILSKHAKITLMFQASISLIVLIVVAARAIGILR
jgi:hypothetical protein